MHKEHLFYNTPVRQEKEKDLSSSTALIAAQTLEISRIWQINPSYLLILSQ